jgi:uncharacterized membrane protein YhaH (DUF805 family)
MIESYKSFWLNYANFNGRTSRAGYWWVFLCNAIINIAFGAAIVVILFSQAGSIIGGVSNNAMDYASLGASVFGGGIAVIIILSIWGLYGLATIVPSLAISVRRLHDTGRRWFWVLLPYVGTVILIVKFVLGFESNAGWTFFVLPIIELAGSIWLLVLMLFPASPNAFGNPTKPYAEGGSYNSDNVNRVRKKSANGYIVGVAGEYSGQNIDIPAGEKIVIGRDAGYSHIVIKNNAAKVSRKHLTVSMGDNGDYIVVDYSSNGTYKADGTRLAAGVPVRVHAGTVIYLGKENNSFRLG